MGSDPNFSDYLRRPYRWLHGVWGAVGLAACVLLALAKGHPPGLVFLPFAAGVWLAGHVLLWLSRRLAIHGRRTAGAVASGAAPARWPPTLVALAFLGGLVSIGGLALVGVQWVFRSHRAHELYPVLLWWVPATLCFLGILLRWKWSRLLAGGGAIFIAVLIIYEMLASYLRGYRNAADDWLLAIALAVAMLLLGTHILRSPAIRVFFARKP